MAESWLKSGQAEPQGASGIPGKSAGTSERTVGERYRVGDLVVDVSAGAVTRGDQTLRLSPLTFDLLAALVRRAPHVVRRQELLATVWPNEFVNDDTLSQRAWLLREALGDATGEPRYLASLRGWGYRLVAPVERLEEQAAPIRALAVLPLANLTGDPQQEYFADGMTESLILALAKIRALKVISRTSVMRYKQADKRLPQIARELGVDAVIEGTVLLAGGRVRVAAQLIRAATDEHLWAGSYDRDLGNIFSLHADLARSIAREVRAAVTPEEQERLERRRPADPAAHEAELRARHFLGKYTPEHAERATAYFEQAVARDAAFGEAYAGLARAFFARAVPLGAGLSVADQREFLSRAIAAATRALALDDTLAEAHAVLGLSLLFHDWDWRQADIALERALDLDYNSSYAHLCVAILAAVRLDRTTTLQELGHAADLDPLNFLIRTQAAECCYWIRDYSRAVEYASQTLDLEPRFPRAHFVLGRVDEAQGRIGEAITEYEQAGIITASGSGAARDALRRGGPAGYHRWALAMRLGGTGGPAVSESPASHGVRERPLYRARNHARLGEIDEAMTCLEEAFQERDCLLVLLKAPECWDPLRADARFTDLVRRTGIP